MQLTSWLGSAGRRVGGRRAPGGKGPRLRVESLEDRVAPAADVGDTLQHALNTRLAGAGTYTLAAEELGNGRYGARDVDLYKFDTRGTELLRVSLGTPPGGAWISPYLRLFDGAGNELPGGTGYDSLEYYFPAAGTYYLGVTGYPNYQYDPNAAGSGTESWYIGDYSVTIDLQAVTPDGGGDTIATAQASGLTAANPTASFTAKIGDGVFAARDVDFYKVEAGANQVITARTSTPAGGTQMQPALVVFDAAGNRLAASNTYGSDVQLTYQAGAAGAYYVGVSGQGNNYYDPNSTQYRYPAYSTGDYKLDLTLTTPTPDAAGDSIPDSRRTNLGPADGTFSATARIGDGLFPLKDVDLYRIDAAAGQLLTATSDTPPGGTSNYHMYLRLFDSSGQQLRIASGYGSGASLKYQFATAGPYYVGFSAGYYGYNYDPNTAGSLTNYGYDVGNADYSLMLDLATPVAGTDVKDTIAEASALTVAADGTASATSVVGDGAYPLKDVDLYSFTAAAGQVLTFGTTTPPGGTPTYTYLRLFDSTGRELFYSSYNGRKYQFAESGTYYLGVANVPYYTPTQSGSGTGASEPRGDYALNLAFSTTTADAAGDVLTDARPTELDGSVAGFTSAAFSSGPARVGDGLYPLKDVDLYRLRAKAGQVVSATASNSSAALQLFDASGTRLQLATFGGRIDFQAQADGDYYVGVSTYANSNFNPNNLTTPRQYTFAADYTLGVSLTATTRDAAGEALNWAQVTNLGPANGTFTATARTDDGLLPFRDVDLYKFEATAGQGLTVNVTSPTNFLYLGYRLFDRYGNELTNTAGYAYPSAATQPVKFQFPESGVYYLGVSGGDNRQYNPVTGVGGPVYPYSNTRGEYTLTMSLLTPPADGAGDMIATALDTGIGTGTTSSYAAASARVGDGWFGGADVDMYKITATAGQALDAVTSYPGSGSSGYLTLRLFDANGTPLATAGNYSTEYPSIRDYVFGSSGTYYVGVSSAANPNYNPRIAGSGYSYWSSPDYKLTLNVANPAPDDEGDTRADALATGLGPADGTYSHDTQIGNGLNLGKDVDFYAFTATAGQVVTARAATPPGGNYLGTYLRLYDSAGNEVAAGWSALETTLARAGDYTVGVSAYPNSAYDPSAAGSGVVGQKGDYRFELSLTTPIPDAVGETFATALDTELGPNAGSRVMPAARVGDGQYVSRDVDMYRFKAQKGQVFRAATSLPPGGTGSNVTLTLFNADGTPLSQSYSDAENASAAVLEFVIPQQGTYYLGVSGGQWYDPNVAGSGDLGGHGDYRLEMGLDKLVRNPVGGGRPVVRVTGNGVDGHQTGSNSGYQFVDRLSVNAWLDEQGRAHGTMSWTTTSHGFPPGHATRAGDPWSVRVDTLVVSGNVAHVEGVVVSAGQPTNPYSTPVGTRVSFDIEDNGQGRADRLNGYELLSGNFTVHDDRRA